MAMSETTFTLQAAPIVEAIVDIDCDLPPSLDFEALDRAGQAAFGDRYPQAQRRMVSEHEVLVAPGQPPAMTSREGLQSLMYLTQDRKQLVQTRPNGFTFNRLAPYTSLDEYLPEIERTWRLFVKFAKPVVVRAVRMRYINRIVLPMSDGKVDLNQYIKLAPRSADSERLRLTGFFDQQTVIEPETGNQAAIVFATKPSSSHPPGNVPGHLPVIFDITAYKLGDIAPDDWTALSGTIASLRRLKNLIFRNSLSDTCLNLFQQPSAQA